MSTARVQLKCQAREADAIKAMETAREKAKDDIEAETFQHFLRFIKAAAEVKATTVADVKATTIADVKADSAAEVKATTDADVKSKVDTEAEAAKAFATWFGNLQFISKGINRKGKVFFTREVGESFYNIMPCNMKIDNFSLWKKGEIEKIMDSLWVFVNAYRSNGRGGKNRIRP